MPRPLRKNRHRLKMRSRVVAELRSFYEEYDPLERSSKPESGFMGHRVLQLFADNIIDAILVKDAEMSLGPDDGKD